MRIYYSFTNTKFESTGKKVDILKTEKLRLGERQNFFGNFSPVDVFMTKFS